MAKQPTLTVNVNSQQFQQFVQNFTNLTKQMQTLNSHFKQITASINQSNLAMRALNATITGLSNTAKGLGNTIGKITKHFISWAAIIGGVTALMGMGGGLFGIERLAASIMARRRLTLGLGGDYGRIQATQIFGQGLMDSPLSALQNVAQGLHGDPSKLTPLLMSGINLFGSQKLEPDEVLDKVMQKAADMMQKTPRMFQLPMAQAMGFTSILDIPTFIRLSTEQGREQLKIQRDLIAKYKDELKLSPRVQKAWAEFSMQLQVAGAQIQKFLGEGLADLAGPLKELSDGFAHLVKILLESETMRDIIKALSKILETWATQLKSLTKEELDKKFKDWGITVESFKGALKKFTEALEGVIPILLTLKRVHEIGSGAPSGWGLGTKFRNWMINRWNNFNLGDTFKGLLASPALGATRPGGADSGGDPFDPSSDKYRRQFQDPAPNAQNYPPPPPSTQPPDTAPPAPTTTPAPAPAPGPTTTAPAYTAPTTPTPGTSLNTLPRSWKKPGMYGPWTMGIAPSMFSPNSFSDPFKAGSTPQTRLDKESALRRMRPGGRDSQLAMLLGGGGDGLGGGSRGPLDSNNWQSSRTTSLTIRNVPGANVFLTSAGMQT